MFRSLIKQSRSLRKNQTPHEKKLWRHLRSRQLQQVKFRRQHTIGSYIVDFCCPDKKVVIELDGGGHAEPSQQQKDKSRDQFLIQEGWKIIRFWNSDIDENFEGVLEKIYQVVDSPSPQPSPQRERGHEW